MFFSLNGVRYALLSGFHPEGGSGVPEIEVERPSNRWLQRVIEFLPVSDIVQHLPGVDSTVYIWRDRDGGPASGQHQPVYKPS